jgi:ketol-acid reductoisomerase
VVDEHVRENMRKALKAVQDGEFAKEWINEYESGCENFNRMRKEGEDHQIEEVGQRLRELMPWIGKKRNIKGSQADYS